MIIYMNQTLMLIAQTNPKLLETMLVTPKETKNGVKYFIVSETE